MMKWSNVVDLPPGHCLITPGYGAISGTQCWSWLSADLALRNSCCQVSHNMWKFMLPCPFITSLLHYGHFVCGKWQGWQGKEVDYHSQSGLFYPLDYWHLPMLRSPFGECLYGIQIFSHLFPTYRCQSTYVFPKCLFHDFSNMLLACCWISSQKTGYGPWVNNNLTLAIFPSIQNLQTQAWAKFLPLWRCLLGVPQIGAITWHLCDVGVPFVCCDYH